MAGGSRRRSMSGHFASATLILERDHGGLEGPQEQQRQEDDRRDPEDEVHPRRRVEQRFDDEGEDDDDRRDGEDHENRGTVAAVGKLQIEPAALADRRDLEEARDQCPLPASRAAAGGAGGGGGGRGGGRGRGGAGPA